MSFIDQLRKAIPQPEFDYQSLVTALADYARPRAKIADLLAKEIIIRVKKGLYVYGSDYRRKPYSREILANLIYGPSCISLDYALAYYGLIPERVETVSSVSPKRVKQFTTAVGVFTYQNVPEEGFYLGIDRIELDDERAFLIARPEKALADKLRHERGLAIRTQKECLDYLVSSLRMNPDDLLTMDVNLVDSLARHYHSLKIRILARLLKKLQNKGGKE